MRIKRDVEGRGVSRWFWVRWGSCGGVHQEEVTSKTSLTNMSKSEKSAYFRHVFAIGFFWVHFFGTFRRIRNRREVLRFMIPILNF
jgi:hypothetical protein